MVPAKPVHLLHLFLVHGVRAFFLGQIHKGHKGVKVLAYFRIAARAHSTAPEHARGITRRAHLLTIHGLCGACKTARQRLECVELAPAFLRLRATRIQKRRQAGRIPNASRLLRPSVKSRRATLQTKIPFV
jgi:hypothetical protein